MDLVGNNSVTKTATTDTYGSRIVLILEKTSRNGMFVYCIENTVNGKKYVGASIDCERRFREHRSKLRRNKHSNQHLQNAWNKYGERVFVFRVFQEAVPQTLAELDKLEEQYVAQFGYYNKRTGGLKHFQNSEETRRKISQSCLGRPSATKGMKFVRTTEQRDESAKTRNPSGYPPLKSPDGCIVEVTNVKRFAEEQGLWSSGVRQLVAGKILSYRGWSLVSVANPFNKPFNISRGIRPQGFPIVISPDGMRYVVDTTLTQFCKQHNLSAGCLSQVINGKNPSHKGWTAITLERTDA